MAAVSRVCALAWLVSLPGLTAARAPVWSSEVALWTDAAIGSTKPRPWLNLASALAAAQRPTEAAEALHVALALSPTRPVDEARVSRAYGDLLTIEFAQYEGAWIDAQLLAANLNRRTAERWPPAVTHCVALRC